MLATEYQVAAMRTAMYPGRGEGYLDYVSKKLPGEVGELLEKFGKKQRRDQTITLNSAQFSEEECSDIIKEAGDILWYVSAILDEFGVTLEEAMKVNLAKLADRQDRGVIQGAGDNR